ncbi:MAG: response regulator [Candidatus Thiodiazotropha sp.]|jgi:two-component system, response regulator PdtaR
MKSKLTTPTHLLLVDDEPIVLTTLSNGLRQMGYRVSTCENSTKAIDCYRKDLPDLVVLDYRIPDINGLELAKLLLDIEHRPIIMLSAYNDLPIVREAIDIGVAGYLTKPVEAERLTPSIEAALARFSEIAALLKQGANIQASIESQRLISTAVGIMMARCNLTQDRAFERLRKQARDQRRPLKDLAFDLVDATSNGNEILSHQC